MSHTEAFAELLQRLHRALAAEADRGFVNLKGSRQYFAEFLNETLATVPDGLEDKDTARRWQELGVRYARYNDLENAARAHLVAETRRFLHRIRRSLEAPAPERSNGRPTPPPQAAILEQPVTKLAGIGPKLAAQLEKLGLATVGQVLRYYPRDYLDYSNRTTIKVCQPGEMVTVLGQVRRCRCFTSPRNHKLSIFTLTLGDGTGQMQLSQFFAGTRFTHRGWQEAQMKQYPRGATVAASGLVKRSTTGLTLQEPQLEVLDEGEDLQNLTKIVPVYPLAEGVGAGVVRRAVKAALPFATAFADPLPAAVRTSLGLLDLPGAIRAVHYPESAEHKLQARRRLVFDEFFFLQLGLLQRRHRQKRQSAGIAFRTRGELIEQFYQLLPFAFTGAQKRVVEEVLADLESPEPMNRLIQGDVGSGKTVVAVVAMLTALQSGYQTALMAPTEVLAEQHYQKLVHWLSQLHLPVELVTGSVRAARRRDVLRQLATGELNVVVGTHALIQDGVQFANLGLVVIDEQHRFGVGQRARLQNKGRNPDLLTMTATPIPRTLALTLHGDLDVSQIDELPPGRKPVRTTVVTPSERTQVNELIRRQILEGRQVYIVLPLIEESEKVDLRSAIEEHERLKEKIFAEFRLGLLHGRLKSEEKEAVIGAFRRHELDLLVSTTVVEVGVDVPNATVMLIEHAERFGLAQLHQLRGRVGRGANQSFCLLMSATRTESALQRLRVLEQSNDGFLIAEMDLRLRGPGEVMGTRQSGLPDMVLSSLVEDQDSLELARREAQSLIERDPELTAHPLLRAELAGRLDRLMDGAILN
ncbi:ATP-dependent DNA helicase RecG [Gloeobacter morelensis]|uniref:ATP-dependent DNA helicase RecG n=1 Tax=Gloeobacter morelensis MG652769 TaxID=2781736 RepID=A0ABY3PJX3_9CYAN|nr:ATP-dependent DNA helicase RecG [Gloeobacter morelensis]UFP93879.1 ATP-dependent DNA helicase RecG [Gloeobacter morelensis MG652769]